jgi:hypothetical protein
MDLKRTVYQSLPESIKPLTKQTYENLNREKKKLNQAAKRTYRRLPHKKTDDELHSDFVDYFFNSQDEYLRYVNEFNEGESVELRNEGLENYHRLTGESDISGGIGLNASEDYYAVIRKLQPDTVVETGVCNGLSTLAILLALRENGCGELHSIDYPLMADESLKEFRQETFEGYSGAAIPSDKQPGWIIPNELRTQWNLTVGKSQRELPELLTELDTLDFFIHDSEHSHPCMMFEYELAYEWLKEGGVILSDDITWNNSFSIFCAVREPEFGRISEDIGYISKVE